MVVSYEKDAANLSHLGKRFRLHGAETSDNLDEPMVSSDTTGACQFASDKKFVVILFSPIKRCLELFNPRIFLMIFTSGH